MQPGLIRNAATRSALLLGIVCTTAVAAASPVSLVSHRAVYDLTLSRLKGSTGIEDVRGRIVMEMEGGCEGYTMNQRMVLELSNSDGSLILSDYVLSTWEEKSGDLMRFTMSNSLNGQTVDRASGIASRADDNGTVVFDGKPKIKDMELPGDILFPVEHTMKILQAAEKGESLLVVPLYDGNGEAGLADTTTVIGKGRQLIAGEVEGTFAGKLSGMKYWPMQLAFFDRKENSTEPDYEVALHMFENGVARALSLQYSDFILDGKLSQLDYLAAPDC